VGIINKKEPILKKILSTALIIFFTALSSSAYAAVLDSQILKEKITKDVEAQLKANKTFSGNVKVEITNLPAEKITIPEGKNTTSKIEAVINSKYINPTTLVKVNVLVNGEVYRSFMAQAKISVYNKIWVAGDYIRRGELLNNVVLQEKETTFLNKMITDKNFQPYEYLAGKNYNPGDALDPVFLEKKPMIVKDNTVSVIFKADSVTVVIPATALDKGNIGDYIKVRSKLYKKDYQGRIIGENLVLVSI
jgi:flagella basal body P-ring formation protein FlgA